MPTIALWSTAGLYSEGVISKKSGTEGRIRKDLLMWDHSPGIKTEYNGRILGDGANTLYTISHTNMKILMPMLREIK